MQTSNYNPKTFLQQVRVIYFALIAGLSFFLLVALYVSHETLAFSFNAKEPFTLLVLLTLVIIPIGYTFSNRIFKSYKPNIALKDKLPTYQQGFIARLAFCDGSGLLSVVCLLLTSNLYFVIFTAIALFVMVLNYPSPERIGEAIDLTPSEIELFKSC